MEEVIPPCGELFAVYELQTCFCSGSIRSHVSDVLGGGKFFS